MSAHLTVVEGSRSVPETVASLQGALADRGIELFAVIDHGAGAASVGLELDDEVVVIFGNPAVGTPVMQADPRSGIDLPLRMLVWRQDGGTRIAYSDPHDLAERYAVPANSPALATMAQILGALVAQISG